MKHRMLALAAIIMAVVYFVLWIVTVKDIYHITMTMYCCVSYILLAQDGNENG